MLNLNVRDETAPLKAVLLGTAQSPGPVPRPEDAYDPKSLEHILAGTYPKEADMISEMEGFAAVFRKYGVDLFRPEVIPDCNQIFSRDIAFVIEDKLIKANILPHREEEFEAILHVLEYIAPENILYPPDEVHIEGGDVMPWNDYIFIGTYTGHDYPDYITARTNWEGVEYIQKMFPHKKVKSFELRKSIVNPKENALHLDCCFQPVGKDRAIICKAGFLVEEEYQWLVDYFGKDKIFEITVDEMYQMFPNVFSISPDVVVSERSFTRLNNWLRKEGFTVEEIDYAQISKQGGLLRCSTMPLVREI
ncbi:dimethylarginine dimethylaminohydrolase family protein [Lentiprolixibacter aurantiacus]|uniref:arginine deiminase n=1 Tax=Lentiprolixibacter aurantiacus TaxID=2993939 RepID=A0AAE3MPK7_9FLAO|nr:arginine deiminase family protein [Lentiprolixibacter aurantiacus]MCX2720654.1 arginine deiminase-related protein [Lentiprolixibacter aurantiacus]